MVMCIASTPSCTIIRDCGQHVMMGGDGMGGGDMGCHDGMGWDGTGGLQLCQEDVRNMYSDVRDCIS